MKSVLIAFVNEDTNDLDRIFHAVFAVYFLRIWRQFLINNKMNKQHFITQSAFEGLEIDLVLLVRLIVIEKIVHLPDICTQHLEKFFRKVRSFSPMESMMATCSLKGFISKVHRIQLEGILLSKFEESFWKKNVKVNVQVHQEKFSNELLDCTMKKAMKQADDEAAKLGIICDKVDIESFFSSRYASQNDNDDDPYAYDEDFLNATGAQIDLSSIDDINLETIEDLTVESIQYPDIQSS